MDAANGKMAEWQSGVWVKSCEKVKYSHYCNTMILDKEHFKFFEKSVIKQIDRTRTF
jgi:hypothetical protein